MKSTTPAYRNMIIYGIPLLLFGFLVMLINSTLPTVNDPLVLGITIDLLLTVPLVYFLLIRRSQIPNTTFFPVLVIGLLIGSYMLPEENQVYLQHFKTWFLPVLELTIFTLVLIKVRTAIHKVESKSTDFYDSLKQVCLEFLPEKLVLPFATEIAVCYYGFIDWKGRRADVNEFTNHRKSGTPSLLGGFILVIAIETVALHFWMMKWSPLLAWIVTGLSIYSAIQVFGFARALTRRPIRLSGDTLQLRYSILNESEIRLTDIDSLLISSSELEKDKLSRKLSPLGDFESHNIIIHLKKEYSLLGIYGIRRNFRTIAFHVDEPGLFKEKVELEIQKTRLKHKLLE